MQWRLFVNRQSSGMPLQEDVLMQARCIITSKQKLLLLLNSMLTGHRQALARRRPATRCTAPQLQMETNVLVLQCAFSSCMLHVRVLQKEVHAYQNHLASGLGAWAHYTHGHCAAPA